jgi:signal transduction histidine kinase
MEDRAIRPSGTVLAGRPPLPRRGPLVTAMVMGFAALVALWLAAGVDLVWRFDKADREVNALTDRVLRLEQALEAIRTSVLLGAIDWRDALLDSASEAESARYLERITDHRALCASNLEVVRREEDPGGASSLFGELSREVDEYWNSVVPILALAPVTQPADIRRIMRDRVIPKRANIQRIVAQVQALNRVQLQRQQTRKAETYARARSRFVLTGSLALLLSVGVAAFVTGYVGRLERALRGQVTMNAQNAADLHRLSGRLVQAQEDERRLIARELHDEVGQALTAVKMQLSIAGRSVPPEDASAIDQARDAVDSALQSARHLSRLLRPPMLDDMGLGPALEAYLTAFGERTGIATGFHHTGLDNRPDPAVELCLFRVAQEATTNVARHSGATSCRVYLQRLATSAVLTVEDDGRGFDPDTDGPATEEGLGLVGIRERVADARGTFRVESTPGNGTRIWVELPAPPYGSADDLAVDAKSATDTIAKETDDGSHPARG